MKSVFITNETNKNATNTMVGGALLGKSCGAESNLHSGLWGSILKKGSSGLGRWLLGAGSVATALGGTAHAAESFAITIEPPVKVFQVPTGAYAELGSSAVTTSHLFPYGRLGYVLPLGNRGSWILDMALNGSAVISTQEWDFAPFSMSATVSPRYVWKSFTFGPEVGVGFNPVLASSGASQWNGMYGLAGLRGTYHFDRHWFLSAGVYAVGVDAQLPGFEKVGPMHVAPAASVGLGYSF